MLFLICFNYQDIMPLPLALQQRLLKRGIIKKDNEKQVPESAEEEVIAESYDEPNNTSNTTVSILKQKKINFIP
jgi:hypothetical protein